MRNKWVVYGAIFLAGVILAGRVKGLPGMNRIPSV